MTSGANLLAVIERQRSELNKSESKVADAILRNPEEATRSSIASLATQAGVSEPSVNRFCKNSVPVASPTSNCSSHAHWPPGVRYVNRAVEF